MEYIKLEYPETLTIEISEYDYNEMFRRKRDMYNSLILMRKNKFNEICEKYISKHIEEDIQVPSNVPITIIKKRLFIFNGIEIDDEELMQIKNGLEKVLVIKYNGTEVDRIRFNVKDDYYNDIMEKITYISLDNKIKEGMDNKNGK